MAANKPENIVETQSVAETETLGFELGETLEPGNCIALEGDLGAGKTALVRGLAKGLGLEESGLVSSPTFVLVHEYPARIPVFHLDLYRMTQPDAELIDLGFDEMLEEGVTLIEWADRAEQALPQDVIRIHIDITGPESRKFTIRRSR